MCNDSWRKGFQLNLMTVDYSLPSKRHRLSLESAEFSPSWKLNNGSVTCEETLPEMTLIQQGYTVNWWEITTLRFRNRNISTLSSSLLSVLQTALIVDLNVFLVVHSFYFFIYLFHYFWVFPDSQSTDMCLQPRIMSVLIRIRGTNPLAFWSHRPSLKAMILLWGYEKI